jgi:hypothetical protein
VGGLVALPVVEQRYRAVSAVLAGASVTEIAAEVGVSRSAQRRWRCRCVSCVARIPGGALFGCWMSCSASSSSRWWSPPPGRRRGPVLRLHVGPRYRSFTAIEVLQFVARSGRCTVNVTITGAGLEQGAELDRVCRGLARSWTYRVVLEARGKGHDAFARGCRAGGWAPTAGGFVGDRPGVRSRALACLDGESCGRKPWHAPGAAGRGGRFGSVAGSARA